MPITIEIRNLIKTGHLNFYLFFPMGLFFLQRGVKIQSTSNQILAYVIAV
jgi:hypothetical protein